MMFHGRFASKPGCHSIPLGRMSSTRQEALVPDLVLTQQSNKMYCNKHLSRSITILQYNSGIHLDCAMMIAHTSAFPHISNGKAFREKHFVNDTERNHCQSISGMAAVGNFPPKAILRCQSLSSLLRWQFLARPMLQLEHQ